MDGFNGDLEAVEAARLGPLDLCVHESSRVLGVGAFLGGAAPVCEGGCPVGSTSAIWKLICAP